MAASRNTRVENVDRANAEQRPPFALCSLTIAVLLLALMSGTNTAFAAKPLVHKTAPVFARADLNNKMLDLRVYQGKVVLLNFWATWCAACLIEMPRFVAWQNKYGPRGLQVIGISMDDDPALVRKLSTKLKLNYPVAIGDEKLGDLYGGVLGLPITYLIDSKGIISARYEGETDLKNIEMQMQSLLPLR